jgi:hypothetical protein
LYGIIIDNGVTAVNLPTYKNPIINCTMFSRSKIHKFIWTSPDGKTHIQSNHILIDMRRHSSVQDVLSFREGDFVANHCVMVENIRTTLAMSKQSKKSN